MLHEILVLLIYALASPICFSIVYPEAITGDAGMAYVVVLLITVPAAAVASVVFIVIAKKRSGTIQLKSWQD